MSGLWEPYRIPIIGLAGEPDSGKTMWGLMASPDCLDFSVPPPTLVWDTEGSSISYVDILNFNRVDLAKESASRKGGKHSNLDMFLQWKEEIAQLESGKYQVSMLDTIGEIEDGLQTYVRMHPGEFGYTSTQFIKMDSLVWTAMKAEWKRLLMGVALKCESVILTTHMMYKWIGKRATEHRIPKGKETIKHVTSLYLILSRTLKPRARQLPTYPSASYGKSRLLRVNPVTGQLEPLLPPYIVNASPDGIREYLKTPPDFNNLKPEEQAKPKQELSDDDKLFIRAGIADDELERAKLEKDFHKEPKMNENHLKQELLAVMSLAEAKVLLQHRYGQVKVAELNPAQVEDLKKHIASLGK